MIILDIETGGLDPSYNPMLSLGAIDLETGLEFYGECRASDWQVIEPKALEVNGFTEEEARDKSKITDVELYAQFKWWIGTFKLDPLIGGQQVGSFDLLFLKEIHKELKDVKWIFGHRSVDLHSIAYAKWKESLSLDGILVKLGLQPEPKPHNALTGAKLEREAFKLLL